MSRQAPVRRRTTPPVAMVGLSVALLASCSSGSGSGSAAKSGSGAAVTAVKGGACGYLVNLGLFGAPQTRAGCGQPAGAPPAAASPTVDLPAGGSATAITANSPTGAKAQFGPAVIFGGVWPESVATAPPSGPITVSTEGTPAGKTVTSSTDIVLRAPPDPSSPGGFGPPPVSGDELHVSCKATGSGVTGSTRFVKALLETQAGREPIPDEPPPNYTKTGVIAEVGDMFTAVMNEQMVNPDGSLTVNAVHLYLFGPVAVGEMVKGQATCGTTPSKLETKDAGAPTCSSLIIVATAPDNPAPAVPRQELIGVFDAGGLKDITNIQVTNGKVQVGKPDAQQAYLKQAPNQTGPLAVTATRSADAEAANLPMTWSFDAIDAAGNKVHCPPNTTTTTK